MLLAVNDIHVDLIKSMSFTPGQTGGEYKHQLSEAEIPKHNHRENLMVKGDGGWDEVTTDSYGVMIDYNSNNFLRPGVKVNATATSAYCSTSLVGDSALHNTVQPYLVVFFWQRTA